MKAMFTGIAAIVIIAVGANLILQRTGYSSQEQQSGAAVRLDK